MQIIGIIHKIMETQQVSATFQKRVFIIKQDNGKGYPELISLEFVQDKVDHIKGYQVGQEVEVEFNLKGREWINPQGEAKYFNTLQAWRMNSSKGEPVNEPQEQQSQTAQEPPPMTYQNEIEEEIAF